MKELISSTVSHLDEINSNKESSISAITTAKTASEINMLKLSTLDTLKASSDSYISRLDTRKDANIAAINSVGNTHKNGLVVDFRVVIKDVPSRSSIIGEIETRDEQLKASLISEMKTQDEQI